MPLEKQISPAVAAVGRGKGPACPSKLDGHCSRPSLSNVFWRSITELIEVKQKPFARRYQQEKSTSR